jgi:hypothetical protein
MSSVGASGNRGVILHLYGSGRLKIYQFKLDDLIGALLLTKPFLYR